MANPSPKSSIPVCLANKVKANITEYIGNDIATKAIFN